MFICKTLLKPNCHCFNYRVFKKEEPKVLGYYTTKKCILGAVEGLIWTTSTQHLIIYIKVFKHVSLKFLWRYLYFNRNLADLGYFRPTFANFLHQNTSYWLNLLLMDTLKMPMGSLEWIIEEDRFLKQLVFQ